MDQKEQMINMFMINNSKFFPQQSLHMVKQRLEGLPEQNIIAAMSYDLKDPTMVLIVSVVAGVLGIDRFLIGDVGWGLLKLFTGGLCGILVIIDWFTISNRTKEVNLRNFLTIL